MEVLIKDQIFKKMKPIILCLIDDKELPCQCRRHKRCQFNAWVRKITWERRWQSIPKFLPGESHGQRSLAVYSPWVYKESHMTEAT